MFCVIVLENYVLLLLSHQQEMRKMLEAGQTLDEVTKISWPSTWVLKQRELIRVVWKPPQEEFAAYDDYMQRHSSSSCACVVLCLFVSIMLCSFIIACAGMELWSQHRT